jgi:hypothetical protein
MGLILDLMVLPLNLHECFGTFKTELQSLFSGPSGEAHPLSGEKNPEPKGSGINPPMMVEETKGA